MFRVLVRLTLPILIVCAILTTLAPMLYQRPVEASPEWEAFGFDACNLPCWAGITIGQTQTADVEARLYTNIRATIDSYSNPSQIFMWTNGFPDYINALVYYEPGYVQWMTYNLSASPNYLIEHVGMPDCVVTQAIQFGGANIVYWVREQVAIEARINGDYADLFTSAQTLYSLAIDGQSRLDCQMKGATRWRGVAPWWRYAQWIEAEGG